MYLQNISETFSDYPDNESLAVIVFFEGCSHGCMNCHNEELQTQKDGHYVSWKNVADRIAWKCRLSETDKVVLSGGDPFFNREEVMPLIDFLVKEGYTLCVYTGYRVEDVEEFYGDSDLLRPQYLKCGRYVEKLRDNSMGKTDEKFVLASTNQRFYRSVDNTFEQISVDNVLYFN